MNSMRQAEAFLAKLKSERVPAVSPEMLARVDKIAKDPLQARAFLQKGGFLDDNGKLAAKYRSCERT